MVAITLLIAIGGFIFTGFAIQQLWMWYVVPFGIMAISIPHALGIDLIVTFLTSKMITVSNEKKSKEDQLIRVITSGVAVPALVLLIGWIVKLFM